MDMCGATKTSELEISWQERGGEKREKREKREREALC
jgi:hypothetical protein